MSGGGDRPPREYSEDGGGEYKETISVETGRVGRIIGSGGTMIQSLQTEHNVKINISKEDNDVSFGLRLIIKLFYCKCSF